MSAHQVITRACFAQWSWRSMRVGAAHKISLTEVALLGPQELRGGWLAEQFPRLLSANDAIGPDGAVAQNAPTLVPSTPIEHGPLGAIVPTNGPPPASATHE